MEFQPNSKGDKINQRGISGIAVNQGTVEQVIVNPSKQTQQKPKQPPKNFPGSLASNFIGRETELAKLYENIQTANQVAICAVAGMGGLGKSELAKQYISKYQESYPGGICWLNATEDDFVSKIIELSGLGNNEALKQRKYLADKIKYCYNNWQWQGNVLLVFDDVQNYQDIKLYLPNTSHSHFKVLITTRKRLGKPVVRLDLDVLEASAALELLTSFIDEERIAVQRETAEELCQWLGYLLLGLELVGRYLAKRRISLAETLERLKNKNLEHKSLKDVPEESNAKRGVKAAFELSWEALQENPDAQETAYFLSVFALATIPQELLENANLREDWEDVEDALVELEDLHLVKSLPEETYLLHSLIREFLHTKGAKFNVSQLKQVVCKVIVAKAKEIFQHITINKIITLSPIIPHLQETATKLPHYLTDEDLVIPFAALGCFHQGQGFYELAEFWLVQGKHIALKRLGEHNLDTATILNNLALLYYLQGVYDKAKSLLIKARKIIKNALPENHPSLAININNLAILYIAQGRYKTAESSLLKAIKIDELALLENHSNFAIHFNNLASLYFYQERYKEAEPLLQKARTIVENGLGKDHPYLISILNNLALLYESQSRVEEAKLLLIKAIEMSKIAFGEKHPLFATILQNIGGFYQSQGLYEEAESSYLKAIDIHCMTLSENHPQFAINLNNLALLYTDQKKYKKADSLFVRALRILLISVGEFHHNFKKVSNNYYSFVKQVIEAGKVRELSGKISLEKTESPSGKMISYSWTFEL